MIYLIDDNKDNLRQREFGITFVEEDTFNGYLTSIPQIEKREKASDISHLTFLNNAKCILLHATTEDWDKEKGFLSGSTTNVTKIREEIADYGDKIPLVLFSGGMGEPQYEPEKNPNFISSMRKNLLYERLWDFVEHYKNTDEIELKILVWGKNFLAQEFSELANKLLESLILQDGTDKLNLSVFSDNQPIFERLISLAFPTEKIETAIKYLETNQITNSDFCKKINLIKESFVKYGKNIHTWK
jgi:hypothetical protein